MRTVLVTGFEPFAGEAINPSAEIVRRLDGQVVAGRRVVGAVLPCVFGASRRELARLLRTVQPELVICTGQAGGRPQVTPERVALNLDDARIPDNAGAAPRDRPVVRGGPAAYFSTLPVKAIVAALAAHSIPAALSQTAGTFVCNHVFYGLMHELARRRKPRVRGGFIHVPWLPEQAAAHPGEPSLALERQVEAVGLAVATSLGRRRDARAAAGAEH